MRRTVVIAVIVLAHVNAVWCSAWVIQKGVHAWDVRRPTSFSEAAQDSQPPVESQTQQHERAVEQAAARSDSTSAVSDTTFERYMREREEAATQAQAMNAAPSPISVQLNLDYTTSYFFRGLLQEDSRLILQPAARFTIDIASGDDWGLSGFLSAWNSFHSDETGADSTGDFTDAWYECDLSAGVTLTKNQWSLTAAYVILSSPNDAFGTVHEIDLSIALDDSQWLGAFALNPYVLLGLELGSNASDGRDPGVYLELGVSPGFTWDIGNTPVSINFPAVVGLSLHDYYQDAGGDDDVFGFAQVGVKAAIPLPFGDRYGEWSLSGGVSAILLGDHASNLNNGDRNAIIGTVGVQVVF